MHAGPRLIGRSRRRSGGIAWACRRLLIEPIRRGIRPLCTLLEPALAAVGQTVLGLAPSLAGEAYFGMPLWIGYAAVMDFLDRVLGVDLDRRFVDAAASCEEGVLGARRLVLCRRAPDPSELGRSGPAALRSRAFGGLSLGVELVALARGARATACDRSTDTITIEGIHAARGPERRRVMIERYRAGDAVCGITAYLRDAGARRLDADPALRHALAISIPPRRRRCRC